MVSSGDVEIYPLVFCVSIGFVIGAFSLARHVLFNPDVNLSRDCRETPAWERYKPEEGKASHRTATTWRISSRTRSTLFQRLLRFKSEPTNLSPSTCKEVTDGKQVGKQR
ncbi:hypothetical protein F441_03802 [Phytophthora nicotianae CJ01A1]|uniref:Uncharacterized protein n=1 Tax=Phytophthora nicotianae CJ01A1 TaxID=1317063 RepID=W2XJD2_PHYNI|nr:hypothetical protein F441_03802 [Phytophthora nicotianae CJ01A1]